MLNLQRLMPLMAIPLVVPVLVLGTRAIKDRPPLPQGQFNARLSAASTSTPYLAGRERLCGVGAGALRFDAPLARATLTYSSAVGARAGESHDFSADVVGGMVRVSLSEAGVVRINPWRVRR